MAAADRVIYVRPRSGGQRDQASLAACIIPILMLTELKRWCVSNYCSCDSHIHHPPEAVSNIWLTKGEWAKLVD